MKNFKDILKKSQRDKFAFTLTEVVITMLIISIVVGVSIRVTKTKLDSIVSYNYYSAYEVIKNVTDKLLSEYNPEKDSYKISFLNNIRSAFKTPLFIQKSFAANGMPDVLYACANEGESAYSCGSTSCSFSVRHYGGGSLQKSESLDSLDCTNAHRWFGEEKVWANGSKYHYEKCSGKANFTTSIDENFWDWTKGQSRDTYVRFMNGYPDPTCHYPCKPGDTSGSCGNYVTDYSVNRFMCPSFTLTNPIPGKPGISYECVRVDDDYTSKWPKCKCTPKEDPEPTPEVCEKECLPTQYLDKDLCQCKSLPMTIPKHDFCKEFESKVNTRALLTRDNIDEYCKGDAITVDTTDFSGKKPDLILPNGMKIYNISQPYGVITGLENNIEGSKFKIIKDDGTSEEIDTNRYGYIAYVDIDGKNSDSILWYDVYPFYITLSGKVIPAYDTSHPGESGGDSTFHLEVSIKDIMQFGRDSWYYRSISFREGACRAGYVGGNYCSENGESYTADDRCLSDDTDCRIKAIRPMRFLGKSFN